LTKINSLRHNIGQMSSIDKRIEALCNLDSKTLQSIRVPIHADREDEKCFLCNGKITKQDSILPNVVFESIMGHVSHGECLEYAQKKYPNIPITQLERKIVRIKVEQSKL